MTSAQLRYEEAEEEDNAAVLHIGAIFIEIYRFLPAVRFGNILKRKSVFCTSQLSDSNFKNEPFHIFSTSNLRPASSIVWKRQ